jgi:ribosomal-protein-alanine N-acetyltransferase
VHEVEIAALRAGDDAIVARAAHLFDGPPRPDATARFLGEPGHHMLVASLGDEPIGFVSGVEITHPDKGTELMLYELAVEERSRRRGVGRALVRALAAVGDERGCRNLFVLADGDNDAALATYAFGDAKRQTDVVMFTWEPPVAIGGASRD